MARLSYIAHSGYELQAPTNPICRRLLLCSSEPSLVNRRRKMHPEPIRNDPRATPPLLTAMTGGASGQAKRSGAFPAVLQKPVDDQQLLDLLEPLSFR
ncbi:hypothetical protein [Aquincola tertiaricarbonis]|uniref:hypothetical protein n=1 Tax=Aquincola tertiaricarbonis TaxID=391953 RepID=UPI0018DE0025|nr:hypothetical protein [Aquincola tertiaricarbonis]